VSAEPARARFDVQTDLAGFDALQLEFLAATAAAHVGDHLGPSALHLGESLELRCVEPVGAFRHSGLPEHTDVAVHVEQHADAHARRVAARDPPDDAPGGGRALRLTRRRSCLARRGHDCLLRRLLAPRAFAGRVRAEPHPARQQ
jgi:hypothetical protein